MYKMFNTVFVFGLLCLVHQTTSRPVLHERQISSLDFLLCNGSGEHSSNPANILSLLTRGGPSGGLTDGGFATLLTNCNTAKASDDSRQHQDDHRAKVEPSPGTQNDKSNAPTQTEADASADADTPKVARRDNSKKPFNPPPPPPKSTPAAGNSPAPVAGTTPKIPSTPSTGSLPVPEDTVQGKVKDESDNHSSTDRLRQKDKSHAHASSCSGLLCATQMLKVPALG